MKKIVLYILSIICLIFIIPYFCAVRFYANEEHSLADEPSVNLGYSKDPHNYSQYGTIKLLDASTNETSEINLDEYLLRSCICRNASELSH